MSKKKGRAISKTNMQHSTGIWLLSDWEIEPACDQRRETFPVENLFDLEERSLMDPTSGGQLFRNRPWRIARLIGISF